MTAENFCYWLKGYFEISPSDVTLNEAQLKMVKQHLDYVFAPKKPEPYDGSKFLTGRGISDVLGGTTVC